MNINRHIKLCQINFKHILNNPLCNGFTLRGQNITGKSYLCCKWVVRFRWVYIFPKRYFRSKGYKATSYQSWMYEKKSSTRPAMHYGRVLDNVIHIKHLHRYKSRKFVKIGREALTSELHYSNTNMEIFLSETFLSLFDKFPNDVQAIDKFFQLLKVR